ncbi:bacterial group 2 Ig-like protein [Bacteroides sp. 2_1_33B]|nr:bacterial group 2 Ig-like protein [Bacteroides sp. 2_1_33B]
MKKSILAIFLAVIAMAQVHAQDSDLRSAPDLPTFKVTLNYSSANTDQGTIISTVATGSKVAYNSKPVFTITAKPGYVLSDITMNTATIGTLPSGTFQNDNTTTYSYTSTALTGSTEIKAVFKAKEQVTVTISPEYATLDEIRAKVNLPKVTFDPVITGYKVQYREDGSAALTDELPEKAGLYYVVVTKSETDTQAAINKEILFKVQPPHTLSYSFEEAQGSVTASMDGSTIANGGEIAYNKPAVLKITSKPGYVLSRLTVDNNEVTLPKGTFNSSTNETSYADYTTSALTASTVIDVRFAAKKTVSVTANPLSATKDEVLAGKNLPVITFTPNTIAGQKVQYKNASGALSDKLPAADGVYTIVATSPETAEYAALKDENMKFTVSKANVLNYNVETAGQGTVTAKMDNKDIMSGGEIAYGKPVIFSIVSNANYRLGAIKQASSDVDISKIKGTYANGNTSYTYTTPNLMSGDSYTFAFVSKDTVRFVANNLVQTVGSIKPVTVTSAVEDIKIEYQLSGTAWVTALPSTLAVGSYKARLSRAEDLTYRSLSDTVTLVVESKKEVESLVLPTPGRIEEGQALSACTLIDGTSSGSFIWKAPNEIASPDKKKYDLIFEPNDPVHYAAKDTFITLNVIPVYSMNVTAGNFGTVILEGRTANDKYARGSVLKATAVADKNYRFAGWSDGNTSATRELQANANLDIVARFDPVLYGVTFTDPMNGSLKVFANGVEVKNGAEFLQGTLLTITATPDAGYMVQSVKVNGALVNNGSYTLTQAADISADFLQKEPDKHLVKVGELKNGSVNLIEVDTKAPVTPGEAISEGVKVKVIGNADYGYELASVKVEGANYNEADGSFMVGTGDVTVSASFQLVKYQITSALNIPNAGKVVLKDKAGKEVASGSKVPYMTQLTASVETETGYRFMNMMVNSSEIKDGDVFTVSGPMVVTANYVEKKDLASLIDKTTQTVVYNKQYRNFEVKITGYSGLDFKVAYSRSGVEMTENPKSAGTYKVRITRGEDDLFKAVDVTAELIIKKAGMALLEVPTIGGDNYEKVDAKLTQDFEDVEWNPSTQKSALRANVTGIPTKDQVNILRFTPLDKSNYESVDYSMPVGEVKTFSLSTSNTEVTNGGLVISDYSEVPENTVLKLRAVAPSENQRFDSWSDNVSSADRKKPEITVTLAADATYTPNFVDKPKITANPSDLEFVYNGSVRLVELKDILSGSYPTDVNIKYSNTDGSVATPLNAGTYLVTVTRTGDENWRSFEATKKLVIKKAKVVKVVAPTASTITEGQSLSESLLSGGVAKGADGTTISGKFEWADASAILKPGNSQKKEVIFTSYDPNYEDATTEAEVTVKSSDALVVTFAQPENGSLKVYMLKGEGEKTEITSGTAVAKATKLTIEAEANPDYELTVIQIGEEKYMTSPVEIEVDKSLAIMAEFKPVSTPPGTDVAVTGVSLNITSKALAVGESFALQAKVTPNNATMKTVSWSSSDETVATVDADGVVTALKIGTCKITVATDDGNKTASCVVTVSGTVSIEQIINDHQIYCERGAITVHPARPISIRIIAVTGVSLYGDSIIGTTRIPVSTGIYLIEINENGKRITVKVNVR